MSIATKRIYAPSTNADGYRVLVDRLWPRGLSKAAAHIDLWLRDIAPSTHLRKWYGHDVSRWRAFVDRYSEELQGRSELLDRLLDLQRRHGKVTLLFAARDEDHNEANVIAEVLQRRVVHAHS